MRRTGFTIMIFIAALTGLRGQDTEGVLSLSLDEAVNYAMEHNKSLENARQELTKSERSIWEAISQGLPQVDASLDYTTYFNYELAFEFGGSEDFSFTDEQLADAAAQTFAAFPGVTQQDLYNYSAGSFYQQTLQSMAPPATILMSDQSTAALKVSQLVFSGQYIVGIQTAKLAKEISKQALSNSEVDTKESVVNAYYMVLITKSSLDYISGNLENLRKMLKQTEMMYETGMAEKTDVDQFRINVNQLENTQRSMERNLELNYNMLRFTLGLPAESEINLTDDLEALFAIDESRELLLSDFSKEGNIGYQIMSKQAEINKKMWDMQKWNYAPTLAAFYNYNKKLLTTGFDMTPNHLAGFSLSVPIFSSGMRDAKVDQARIEYEISERNTEIMGDQLELQARQLKYNLQSSIDNYVTQKENVEVAQEVLNNYQMKFRQGMASSLDVTQANSNYLEAQSTYLNAMFELMNARIQLQKLMSNLENF